MGGALFFAAAKIPQFQFLLTRWRERVSAATIAPASARPCRCFVSSATPNSSCRSHRRHMPLTWRTWRAPPDCKPRAFVAQIHPRDANVPDVTTSLTIREVASTRKTSSRNPPSLRSACRRRCAVSLCNSSGARIRTPTPRSTATGPQCCRALCPRRFRLARHPRYSSLDAQKERPNPLSCPAASPTPRSMLPAIR